MSTRDGLDEARGIGSGMKTWSHERTDGDDLDYDEDDDDDDDNDDDGDDDDDSMMMTTMMAVMVMMMVVLTSAPLVRQDRHQASVRPLGAL